MRGEPQRLETSFFMRKQDRRGFSNAQEDEYIPNLADPSKGLWKFGSQASNRQFTRRIPSYNEKVMTFSKKSCKTSEQIEPRFVARHGVAPVICTMQKQKCRWEGLTLRPPIQRGALENN